jgi:HNH endonuclease
MPTKPIDRLSFEQGGCCFFCQRTLATADASVEHLVAISNGGSNDPANCVVCCKALNALLGRMSLKEKLRVILNQRGEFKCPNGVPVKPPAQQSTEQRVALIVKDLRKRGTARPGTVERLSNTIAMLFQKKKLTKPEISLLLKRLESQGIISVSGTKVTYAQPPKVAYHS